MFGNSCCSSFVNVYAERLRRNIITSYNWIIGLNMTDLAEVAPVPLRLECDVTGVFYHPGSPGVGPFLVCFTAKMTPEHQRRNKLSNKTLPCARKMKTLWPIYAKGDPMVLHKDWLWWSYVSPLNGCRELTQVCCDISLLTFEPSQWCQSSHWIYYYNSFCFLDM